MIHLTNIRFICHPNLDRKQVSKSNWGKRSTVDRNHN